jgi:GrpB-like predicted nucleotidyltransferase (UPF0157 family)
MILAPYNPAWAAEFAALRDVYATALGKLVLRVEHVGSTAVLGLLAKPILDIDIVMPGYDVFPDRRSPGKTRLHASWRSGHQRARGIQTAGQVRALHTNWQELDAASSLCVPC